MWARSMRQRETFQLPPPANAALTGNARKMGFTGVMLLTILPAAIFFTENYSVIIESLKAQPKRRTRAVGVVA